MEEKGIWQEFRVERPPELREQTLRLLRLAITGGHIGPGEKVSERKVAEWLDTSRTSVHDALVILQREGLITRRSDGRYVAELTQRDIRETFVIRRVLECLAVELACRNMTSENGAELAGHADHIVEAIEREDMEAYVQGDLALHRAIWRMADNERLERILESSIAPIMIVRSVDAYRSFEIGLALVDRLLDSPDEVVENIKELVQNMIRSDVKAATENIVRDLERAWRKKKLPRSD